MTWSNNLSNAVQSIAPSGIRKFFDIAAQMEDVVSLGVGEPDFITPWTIRESCVYGLDKLHRQSRYAQTARGNF